MRECLKRLLRQSNDNRPLALTCYFVATSAIVILVATIVIAAAFSRLTRRHLIDESQDDAVAVTLHMEQEIGPALVTVLASPEGEQKRIIRDQLESQIIWYHDQLDIAQVRVYDAHGNEIFSEAPIQGGTAPETSPGLSQALAGRVWSRFESEAEIAKSHRGTVELPAYVVETYVPVRSVDGRRVVGVLEIYRDVTADYQRAQRLQNRAILAVILAMAGLFAALGLIVRRGDRLLTETHRRFRNILDTTADAIICSDEQGRIILWNRAAERMFGYSAEDVLGQPYRRLLAPERDKQSHEAYPALPGNGEPLISTGLRRDGTTFPIEVNHATYHGTSGREISAVMRDITRRKRMEETLRNIAEGVSAATGAAFFRSLVQHLADALAMDYALVGEVLSEKPETVRTLAVYAQGEFVDNFEYRLAHTPCENVVGKELCSYSHGVQQRFPRDHLLAEMEAESYVGTPLFDSGGRALGLVAVLDREPLDTPDRGYVEIAESMLQIFAVRASAELERVQAEEEILRLYADLEDAYVETVAALANAMDARDTYTGDHSYRLAKLAVATAKQLGCDKRELDIIRWGALLHDIGKIGVPDCILRKPGALSRAEWDVIKQHPNVGAEIVAPVKHLADVAPLIRAHQERYDGGGYPDGLRGEEIPLGARIIAVVDAYSAIIDDRPYNPARTHAEAVAELQRCAGTQFDPRVVRAFLQVLNRRRVAVRP